MPGLVEIRPATTNTEPLEPPPATKLEQHLNHFHHRVLQDALLEGTAAYWLRRADTFASVGTTACDAIALACRNKATFIRDTGLDAEVQALLRETSPAWE